MDAILARQPGLRAIVLAGDPKILPAYRGGVQGRRRYRFADRADKAAVWRAELATAALLAKDLHATATGRAALDASGDGGARGARERLEAQRAAATAAAAAAEGDDDETSGNEWTSSEGSDFDDEDTGEDARINSDDEEDGDGEEEEAGGGAGAAAAGARQTRARARKTAR
jgi:hypothetical protein